MNNVVAHYLYLKYKKDRKVQVSAKKCRVLSSVLALAVSMSVSVFTVADATENGLTHYPTNVNTVANGILPAPGTATLDVYNQWYNAPSFAGPTGKSEIPGFDTSMVIVAPRILYTIPKELNIIKGFNSALTIGFIMPILNLNMEMGPLYGQPATHGHIAGIGDVTFETDLSFDRPQKGFFSYVGLDTFFPTGSYRYGRLANLGYNYRTFEPQYNITWFVNRGLALNETFIFDINTTNKASGYHSGADFENDYAVNYAPFQKVAPNLNIGFQGYIYKQIQDDTQYGAVYNNGNRGQAFGVGPQILIRTFDGKGGILIKYTHQFAVRNQAKGDKLWLEFSVPIG